MSHPPACYRYSPWGASGVRRPVFGRRTNSAGRGRTSPDTTRSAPDLISAGALPTSLRGGLAVALAVFSRGILPR